MLSLGQPLHQMKMQETNEKRKTDYSRRSNLALSVFWLGMVGFAFFVGWYYSVAFIAACSIYANFASHVAAWRSDANPNQEQLDRLERKLDEVLKGV